MSSEQTHDASHYDEERQARPMPSTPPSKTTGVWILVVLLVLAVVLAAIGILHRVRTQRTLAADTNAMAIPNVLVIHPKPGAPMQELVLPGNIQAFTDAPIYARTNGYLKKWYFDIGARVKKGDLIAVIETPELDQQVEQAKADLATAQANLQLAQATANRYTNLLASDSVSRQNTENFVADAEAKRSIVASAQASLGQLEQLQSFEKIIAPFDGVITARNTDVGQLINSGSASTSTGTTLGNSAAGSFSGNTRELFHVAAINKLRVYINVPQIYSRSARPGTAATLTLPEFPGRTFPGRVVRNANSIELSSRTLLAEVDVDNPTGDLLPGAYAEVHLKVDAGFPTLILPVSSLIFRAQGLQAAVLENGNTAHLVSITLGRDYGSQVEVITGLQPGQTVIDSPPDSLTNGEQVRVVQEQPQGTTAGGI